MMMLRLLNLALDIGLISVPIPIKALSVSVIFGAAYIISTQSNFLIGLWARKVFLGLV